MGEELIQGSIEEQFRKQKEYWNKAPPGAVGPFGTDKMESYFNNILKQVFKDNCLFDKLLDFGCGTGRAYPFLIKLCKEYYGVDISENYLNIFRKNHPEANLTLLDSDILPFPDSMFDIIYCYSVLTHTSTEQDQIILREMSRCLKKEGYLFVTIFDPGTKGPWICKNIENFTKSLKDVNIETVGIFKVPETGSQFQTMIVGRKV